MRRVAVAALLALTLPAHAQQYRSEVRELEVTPPEQQSAEDPAKLLATTTDPYARALLLRELAARTAAEGDAEAAARYLEQALATGSLSDLAAERMRADLTRLYAATGRHDEVVRLLLPRYRGRSQMSVEELVALGAALVELGRHAEAIGPLERAIAATPRPDESWRAALLAAYVGAGRYQQARALAANLARLYPARSDYWLHWTALLLRAGMEEKAAAVLALAARQGHLNEEDQRLQLVALTARVGAPFLAGSMLQRWLEAGEVQASAERFETLAGLWSAARECTLAARALEQALAQQSRPQWYLQLGQLYMDLEDYARAAEAIAQAIDRGAASGSAFMALAMARYQLGDVEAAIQAFDAARQYRDSRQLAAQWSDYLRSTQARQLAMEAAVARARQQREDEPVRLATSPDSGIVQVGVEGSAPPQQAPVASTDPFTPVGAERPGNADGTIPAWTGGITRAQWPAGFALGERVVDPYPADQPLFEISARNMDQYAERLSDGHRALLRKYPDYRMPVYPSRRSVGYPQAVYEATRANRGRAKLLGSDALSGARLGFPFPRPESGVEIMWNHRVRYRGDSAEFQTASAVVAPDGRVSSELKSRWKVYYRYANVSDPVDIDRDNILLYGVTWSSRDGRAPDFVVLFHETANSIRDPRKLWVLLVDVGRMLRIPPMGYDQPLPGTEGLYLIDQIDMYNGAFDRYVWRLLGKRELYIPYNSYRLNDGRYRYADILHGRFINPDTTRYELHRVWVIEATERGGKRHVFGKRIFYVDEDSWNVVLVENHDREGNLWRFQEGHLMHWYDRQATYSAPVVTYDLKDGRYYVNFLTAEEPPPQYDLPGISSQDFLPARIKARYSR